MNNWQDNLWVWAGWLVIKWIFGFFILSFILLQIWNVSTIEDYDKKVIEDTKSTVKNTADTTILILESLSLEHTIRD